MFCTGFLFIVVPSSCHTDWSRRHREVVRGSRFWYEIHVCCQECRLTRVRPKIKYRPGKGRVPMHILCRPSHLLLRPRLCMSRLVPGVSPSLIQFSEADGASLCVSFHPSFLDGQERLIPDSFTKCLGIDFARPFVDSLCLATRSLCVLSDGRTRTDNALCINRLCHESCTHFQSISNIPSPPEHHHPA